MSKIKLIIIAIIAIVLVGIAFPFFKKSPQAVVYSASKKSFEFVKDTAFVKKPFNFKSGEFDFTALKNEQKTIDLLVSKDAKGHYLIMLDMPEGKYTAYLVDNDIILNKPSVLLNDSIPGVFYYKFNNGTLDKLKKDFVKLKLTSDSNTKQKINKEFLSDLKNFALKNAKWSKTNGEISVKFSLIQSVDFISQEIDKLQKIAPISQGGSEEQIAVIKDMASTILDDAMSDSNLNDKQKDNIKKQVLSYIDNGEANNLINKNNDIKQELDKLKENLDPSDMITITFGINKGKISEITISMQIKSMQDKNAKLTIKFTYQGEMLQTIAFDVPPSKDKKAKSFMISFLYSSKIWSGIKVSDDTGFEATLKWKINEQVPDVVPPSLVGAINVRPILQEFVEGTLSNRLP